MKNQSIKKNYEPATMEVVRLELLDIITTSLGGDAGDGGYEDEL